MTHESPRGGLRATGTGPHHRTEAWPSPEGGYKPLSEIGDPITDAEVRALELEPAGWRGWRPTTPERAASIAAAAARIGPGSNIDPIPFRIPGEPVECSVCGEPAPPSTCGTPVCGGICVGVLLERLVSDPALVDAHFTRGDGSGGLVQVRPPAPKRKRIRLRPIIGRASVERALERLVDCRTVLERHGADVRWGRTARCPFHDDEHPSMSLYERGGRSRAHCFPCDFDGDPIDLEAAITGEDLKTTIRRWG
jgi:hypothetical protein